MLNRISFVSGFGKKHTNEADPSDPGKLLRPYAAITWEGIKALVDYPLQVDKARAQWLIPSTLPRRNAKAQEADGEFWLLWADIDKAPPTHDELLMMLDLVISNVQFEIYASRSATEDCQKARILIPLAAPLSGADWKLTQKTLNDELEALGIIPDRANEGAAQLCYLPNRGRFYASKSQRSGPIFQPLRVWAKEIAEKRRQAEQKAAEIEGKRQAAAERRAALTPEDLENSLIHVFNAAYPVEEVLLRAGYDQDGDHFRHPQSESGSFSASIRDGRVHSLSSSDPVYTGGGGGGAHDAFGAFTILFAGGDQEEAARLAGDQWLTIGGESWNVAKRREYAQQKAQGSALDGFYVLPDNEATRGRFTLLTAQELALLPPVCWRIKGILPESGIAALYGPPACGKSFLVLDMLAAIAAGRPWFGHKASPAPAVYIALEGEAGIAQRIQAWQQVNGTLPDTFRAILTGLDIRKDGDRAALGGAIRETGMAGGVIVVDTLNQAAAGMDENDSAAMGLAIAGVKHLQRELGGLVLLIHHSGKDASKGLRGHSSLLAALDASIEVSREGDKREWRIGKAKDGVDGAGHPFALETVSLGVDDDLTEITSCVVKPSSHAPGKSSQPKAPTGINQKIAWGVLQKLFQEAADSTGLDDAERPRILLESAIAQIGEKLPVEDKARRRERAQSAISGLTGRGLIECADGYLLEC